MRLRLRPALVALLLGGSGCFIFHRGKLESPPAFAVPEGEIALSVTNHNYLDVVIYVLHDGVQTRVGTVRRSNGESGRPAPTATATSPRVLARTSAITASMCATDA